MIYMTVKKLNGKELVDIELTFAPMEISLVLDKGVSMTFIDDSGKLYCGHYERDIDAFLISHEITPVQIASALAEHMSNLYMTALKNAQNLGENAIREFYKKIESLQK